MERIVTCVDWWESIAITKNGYPFITISNQFFTFKFPNKTNMDVSEVEFGAILVTFV